MNITDVSYATPTKSRSPFGSIHPIPEVAIESFHGNDLRDKIDEFNIGARRANDNRTSFEAFIATRAQAKPAEMEFDDGIFGATTANVARLLQEELRVRAAFTELEAELRHALQSEATRAAEECLKAEADLVKTLLSIGYLPMLNGAPRAGSYVPDFLNRHPKVREARAYSQSTQARATQHDAAHANEDAMTQIEARLERIREKALAV